MVAGFAAGLAGVLLLLRPPPAKPPPAAPIPRPTVAVKPAERSAAVPTVRGKEAPPRARVERWTAPAAPSVPTETITGAISPTAAQPAAPSAPSWAPGTNGTADPGPQADSGLEHVVRVQGVAYTSAPERRTATLVIDGAPAVTLRQGESAGSIEVQLIMRDQVYLRYGADVFAAGVER